MKKTDYQKFTIETISRSDIKNAEYNPRRISESAKVKLREALEKHGLVEPVVWNRKTGNLVGGHQRLEQLDSLEGTSDYRLDVAVIYVDEREEAVINVQLNNPSMQGEWDTDKLADLAVDFDINFEELGFDDLDVDFLFDGDDRFSELYETEEVQETKEKLDEIRDKREAGKEILKEDNSVNFYSMIVFADEKERDEFYEAIGVPVYEEILTVEQISRYDKE